MSKVQSAEDSPNADMVSFMMPYRIESAVFMTIGLVFFLIGVVSIYARRFPWNADTGSKLFVQYTQYVNTFGGLIMAIWSVDPKGVFGIYNMVVLIVCKDTITMLATTCSILYAQVLGAVYVAARYAKRTEAQSAWISIGIPLVCSIVVDAITTCFSLLTNQEVYRAIFFGFIALVLGFAGLCSFVMYRNTVSSESIEQQSRKDSSGRAGSLKNRLLGASILFCLACSFEIYVTASVLIEHNTLTAAQIVDPVKAKYSVNMITVIYSLAFCGCTIFGWLPLFNPVPPKASMTPVHTQIPVDVPPLPQVKDEEIGTTATPELPRA
eukprot:TRINITY_DN792_c0_g2_i1.p1 TRINITY_DN792_c0_g2~~TRINITY_DN792_c0_g2_i1.p1  ORF type:complete len:324 (-),score=68.84 TRINITY_DN792_c0_g2_i1:144-1115(-)